jgi:Flp pilus assembly protein TadD
LRNTNVPAFQDTYGWIEFRRGNIQDAIGYLEPAANVLTTDALAQFHLGMAYAATGRKDAALERLNGFLGLSTDLHVTQRQQARDQISALTAKP